MDLTSGKVINYQDLFENFENDKFKIRELTLQEPMIRNQRQSNSYDPEDAFYGGEVRYAILPGGQLSLWTVTAQVNRNCDLDSTVDVKNLEPFMKKNGILSRLIESNHN